MNLHSLLKKHGLQSLKINAKFLELAWEPSTADQDASWELYVELLTRVTTQPLNVPTGKETAALASVYSLFPTTREILKRKGRMCNEFPKIAIVVLNQIIRPFTAKWHQLSEENAFGDSKQCEEFRNELKELQIKLKRYSELLAAIAEVEDLTEIEHCNE